MSGSAEARQRREALSALARMHAYLCDAFASLDIDAARQRLPPVEFSPVEQVWHLADLELEGFGLRIRALLTEDDPLLADFDGGAIAREREYRSRSLADGLRAFHAARQANLAAFAALPPQAWSRGGTQEGVGGITLGDLPALMRAHDDAHRAEILQWLQARG